MPPYCEKVAACGHVEFVDLADRLRQSPAGATIQPSRQPVMHHALEKLLTEITGSSGVAMSSSEGAWSQS